jgi:hypothetical protein
MTSLSRRKRQTTASDTPTISRELPAETPGRNHFSKKVLVTLGLLVAALMLSAEAVASAAKTDDADAYAVPIRFSTGRNGSKLVWLPYRPSAAELRKARAASAKMASRVEYQAPTAPSQRAGDDPMSNPFGDRTSPPRAKSPTPAVKKVEKVEKKPFQGRFLDPTALPERNGPTAARTPDDRSQTVAASSVPSPIAGPKAGKTLSNQLDPEPLLFGQGDKEEPDYKVLTQDGCPPADGFKPINELTTNITASSGDFPAECSFKEQVFEPRAWSPTTFTWTASGLCHKPLYFEELQLERYGHSWGPYLQPIISHAHFFVTVPILPYKMGVYPPNECLYTLGYYRPGSCAPYMIDPVPISVRGGLWEAGAWVGGAALVP